MGGQNLRHKEHRGRGGGHYLTLGRLCQEPREQKDGLGSLGGEMGSPAP